MTTRLSRTALLSTLAGMAVGCSGEPVDLVSGDGWVMAPASADPMPAHAEAAQDCSPAGYYSELGGLEVDTELCAYALLQQPILARVRAGDTLTLNWFHSDLVSAEPSTGHLLLSVDGELIYERVVDIPTDARRSEERR